MNYRLNHLALCVKCPEKSAEFYQQLFGLLGLYVERRAVGENIMILSHSGTSLGLKKSERSGSRDGVDHFGFTTDSLEDLESLSERLCVKGIPFERKEHRDGSRSLFMSDPDGYLVQIVCMPVDMFIKDK